MDASRRCYDLAWALYLQGRYFEALDELAGGYASSGSPTLLVNMGLCAQRAGDLAQARRHYQHYLRAEPGGVHAGLVRERLLRLEALPVERMRESA